MSDELEWYIAGLFDGEGNIHFREDRRSAMEINITNTDERVIRQIHKELGLGYVDSQKQREDWSEKYSIRIRSLSEAKDFLRMVEGKVRIKKEDVKKALERVKDYEQRKEEIRKRDEKIVKLLDEGLLYDEIANEFDMSRQNVSRIAKKYNRQRYSSSEERR